MKSKRHSRAGGNPEKSIGGRNDDRGQDYESIEGIFAPPTMIKRYVSLLLIFFIMIVSNVGAAQPQPPRQEALLYLLRQECGSCHGLTLQGGLGPPLTPEALLGKSAEALADVISEGVPKTAMPPWKTLLTREEILWLTKQLLEGIAP